MSVRVRVQPRASRDSLEGEREGALVVRLKAPPVDGEANDGLVRFLGRSLRVAPSSIAILRGASARDKVVRIDSLSAAELLDRLGLRTP